MYPNFNNLQGQITNNYNIAKSYYTQKKQAFLRFLNKDIDNFSIILEQYINEKIDTFDKKITQEVYSILNDENTGGWNNLVQYSKNLDPKKEYPIPLKTIFEKLASGKIKTRNNLASALGIEFEKFLAESLVPEQYSQAMKSVISSAVNDILSGFSQTGGISSKSAVTKGGKDIRPDIGLNIKGGVKSKGIQNLPNSNLGVELTALIDLNNFTSDKLIKSNDILSAYLNQNSYGFSVKIWKNSNSKVFSNSSILKKQIQNEFNQANNNNHTWSSVYASEYTIYQISRFLINIINPLDVAMLTGQSLIWMDDFIDRHLFYMDVQLRNKLAISNNERGGGWEGHPYVMSSAIKLREMTSNNINHLFTSSVSKDGIIIIKNRKMKTI